MAQKRDFTVEKIDMTSKRLTPEWPMDCDPKVFTCLYKGRPRNDSWLFYLTSCVFHFTLGSTINMLTGSQVLKIRPEASTPN